MLETSDGGINTIADGTHRVRKVKCDASWPACDRCISTGRICDGYGIWGGGGNYYGQRTPLLLEEHRTGRPQSSISAHTTISTAEEKLAYDWFLHRTTVKIPGCFILDLWESVVLPTSLREEVVLHALLSVSYAHFKGTISVEQGVEFANSEPENERRLLRHYVKAIQALNHNVLDKENSRTTLISCLLFTYLELLQGHFQTAQGHMFGGLRILRQLRHRDRLPNKQHSLLIIREKYSEKVDNWISDAFSRLYVQVCLLNPGFVEPIVFNFEPRYPHGFAHMNEAWRSLETILCKTATLKQESNHQANVTRNSWESRQADLTEDLTYWQNTFDRSSIHDSNDPRKAIAALMLTSYHAMATIMVQTCLSNDEMLFDSFTESFVRILTYSSRI